MSGERRTRLVYVIGVAALLAMRPPPLRRAVARLRGARAATSGG